MATILSQPQCVMVPWNMAAMQTSSPYELKKQICITIQIYVMYQLQKITLICQCQLSVKPVALISSVLWPNCSTISWCHPFLQMGHGWVVSMLATYVGGKWDSDILSMKWCSISWSNSLFFGIYPPSSIYFHVSSIQNYISFQENVFNNTYWDHPHPSLFFRSQSVISTIHGDPYTQQWT